ncbi:MAG: adenosylcobinamide amidohydrolase [Dehalococcoidia bacterium]
MSLEFKEIPWELEGARAQIAFHMFQDVPIKTLLITLPEPAICLNSREGFKRVKFVANSFNPPQLWDFVHEHWQTYEEEIFNTLDILPSETALLSTGVDMENFSLAEEELQEFRVSAFVTAGVSSNAMRVGVDRAGGIERNGKFEMQGTINTIVLTNATLSEGAMTRAIITATEAKTLALQDLDVQSSYNNNLQATGTGTDNVVIVSGRGPGINYTGGHSKLGELLARAVTCATRDAIVKNPENQITGGGN